MFEKLANRGFVVIYLCFQILKLYRMMKAIDWKSILGWWGKLLQKEEKKPIVNNEEKPVPPND